MIDGDELFNKVLQDFEAEGSAAIDRLAKADPVAYLWLIVAVICDVHEYVEV
jgi:hypothetical protein